MTTLTQLPYALMSSYQEQRTSRAQQRELRAQNYNSIVDSLTRQKFSLRTYNPQRKDPTIDVLTTPSYEQLAEDILRVQEAIRTPLRVITARSIGRGREELFPEGYTANEALDYANEQLGQDLGYITFIGEQNDMPFALRVGAPRPLRRNWNESFSALRKGWNRADNTLVALLGR